MADVIGLTLLQFLEIQQHPDGCDARAEVTLLHKQSLPLLHLAGERHFLFAGQEVNAADVLEVEAQQVVAAAPADPGLPRRSSLLRQ